MTTTEGIAIPQVSVNKPASNTGRSAMRAATTSETSELASSRWRRPSAVFRTVLLEVIIVAAAAVDMWLMWQIIVGDPEYRIETYSLIASVVSCAVLPLRRRWPFVTMLVAVPGFFFGWAQFAVMFALGYLALRLPGHWKMWVGAGLLWVCRFIVWPLEEFTAMQWQEHALDVMWATIVAGLPVAIGLLIHARGELSARLRDLAESRDRERRLHAQAVRAEERARLAREMHDVVSHDITLIAMQAGVLTTLPPGSDETHQSAQKIRELSTSTLEELRSLVSVLRSGHDDGPQPDLASVDDLIEAACVPVKFNGAVLPRDLPSQVSAAAYRTVQECLTNVRKHAPGATAFVRLDCTDDSLAVEVTNDRPSRPHDALPSGGYGLAGLAERARLLGGSFDMGTTEEGGFRVLANYPIRTAVKAAAS